MKKIFISVAMLLALSGAGEAKAQAVVFPQEKQAGTAASTQADGVYTLSNDLFSVSFTEADGHLTFGGSEALNLKAGSELFSIVLGSGEKFSASDMTLESVALEELTADPTATKGSDRFAGKAVKAVFKKDGLTATWHAVLRDGSHYIRTEVDLESDSDLEMESVTPMIYTVDNEAAGSAPKVVGNTRGAVLISDKIFAGLETPMGVNSVLGDESDLESFTATSWTASSFTWAPGDECPSGLTASDGNAVSGSEVQAARGYVTFRKAGKQTLTFQYTSGSHRLNIAGVDVVNPLTGKVLASDYHYGYTGGLKQDNVYTLDIPEAGTYILRYFIEVRTETITSSGTVTFSEKIGTPVVVHDLTSKDTAAPRRAASAKDASDEADATAELLETDGTLTHSWTPSYWTQVGESDVPSRINEVGYYYPRVWKHENSVKIDDAKGTFKAEFVYSSGAHALQITGVDLVDAAGDVVAYDYHFGTSGHAKTDNTFSFNVPYAGTFKLRYFTVFNASGSDNTSSGTINVSYTVIDTLHLAAPTESPIQGYWRRKTTLTAGTKWNVSSVVGLVAEGQQRRSFLAYSERERAVPWRAMPVYISWYELNIDRNNAAAPNYTGNMTEAQCLDVVQHWYDNFYTVYGKAPKAFVWDDGWDEYGTWTFNCNFPNGFSKIDALAKEQGTGIGAWLGPVGGYGTSGTYRRNYWSSKGGMQLSNASYYQFFIDACSKMVSDYDFRFFKYDGISAQFSAVGPDDNDTGYNNAEAIISIERAIREKRPDIFFNTTVGTWASPFWFHFTDAVWRQENDYGTTGVGTDREKWITYRDRLVYQNFVQNSPICPINTLMTHGFILSSHGNVSKDMSYAGVVRELRCAFACGSGMVELYNDYALMNSIQDGNGKAGALWGDLAECMTWQENNADVLPDIHWVGGNPWTGSKAEVYGWAAWNGKKAVLTLRNGATSAQVFKTTLRKALDIPAYVKTSITLSSSFADQTALKGLDLGTPIDIDTELSITIPASTVFVSEGVDNNPTNYPTGVSRVSTTAPTRTALTSIYDLSGRRLQAPQKGINIIDGKKVIK